MSLKKTDLRDAVWQRCGRPVRDESAQNVEVTNEEIEQFLDEALERITDWVPNKTVRYITTVADQQTYSVPSSVLNILDVYRDSAGVFYTKFDDDIWLAASPLELQGISIYLNPALYDIVMGQVVALERMNAVDFDFDPTASEVTLMPQPSSSGDRVYYLAAEAWEWTDSGTFPLTQFRRAIMLWAEYQVLAQLEQRRSKLSGQPRAGGTIGYQAGFVLESASEKRRIQFEAEALRLSKVFL